METTNTIVLIAMFITLIAMFITMLAFFWNIIKRFDDVNNRITNLEIGFNTRITNLEIETKIGFEQLHYTLENNNGTHKRHTKRYHYN
jgi:predicted PurR-regulated permease PerM